MAVLQVECFGGPIDGQTMPMPDEAELACGVAVDKETGEPHFYVLAKKWSFEELGEKCVFEYFGNNPARLVSRLRNMNSPLADQIEAELYGLRDDEPEFENDDD